MYIYVQQHSKFTEDANWNKPKRQYSQNTVLSRKWYCQTLEALTIISIDMKISLFTLIWWCFGWCLIWRCFNLIWKFAKIWSWKIFSWHLWQNKPLWLELKTNGRVHDIFYFFRNSEHPENWSVSFKNLFRKCECISCYLPVSSNL